MKLHVAAFTERGEEVSSCRNSWRWLCSSDNERRSKTAAGELAVVVQRRERLTGLMVNGRPAVVVAAVAVSVASWSIAVKYFGSVGAATYMIVLVAVSWWAVQPVTARLRQAPSWVVPTCGIVIIVMLVVVFVIGYPLAHSGVLGVGSDRADALNVALNRLSEGRYPYAATTYLGNQISPLPGALLIAAPVWLVMGDAAWQNVIWVPVLLVLLGRGRTVSAEKLVSWILITVASVETVREFVVGDDLFVSAVPVVVATRWVMLRCRGNTLALAALSAVLGIVTCSRPHMILIVVIVVAHVYYSAGMGRAVVVLAGSAAAWIALVAPFAITNWAAFSPLHVISKVSSSVSITPQLVLLALFSLIIVLVVLMRLGQSTAAQVAWTSAGVLLAPSLISFARGVAYGGAIDLTLGAAALPFVGWAVANALASPEGMRHPEGSRVAE